MSFKDFFAQQKNGLEAMANTGVIGLHLVSGPMVGFAIGYGLDIWLDIAPWGKLVFLLIGIGAGFLNVYRDTQALLRKMARQDVEHTAQRASANAGQHDGENHTRSEKPHSQP